MNDPLMSIVMPVYNAENYLEESINSILSQTYTKYELIIINDGSTDKSLEIINSFIDRRIKTLSNKHDFVKSLNLGIDSAKGKYIVRMDADDIMLPFRLEKQFHYMENHPEIDISGSWVERFGEQTEISQSPIEHKEIVLNMIFGNTLFHPTIIMRKSSILKYSRYPNIYMKKYIYAEDYKLWIELAKRGYRFANIPQVLLKYRVSKTQITSKHFSKTMYKTALIQNSLLYYIANEIINMDANYFDILSKAIELANNKKLKIESLKFLLFDIYNRYL